jgi:hypothetical protein
MGARMKKIIVLVFVALSAFGQNIKHTSGRLDPDSTFSSITVDSLLSGDSGTVYARHMTLDTIEVVKYFHQQEVGIIDSLTWWASDGDTIKIDPSVGANVISYEDENVIVAKLDSAGNWTAKQITATDTLVSTKGIRNEGPSTLKGAVTVGTTSAGANLTVNPTTSAEKCVTPLAAGDWTLQTDGTGAWAITAGVLSKTVTAGTLTATEVNMVGAGTVTAGRTYEVTITCSAVGATAPTFTLGGSTGSVITAATWTDRIVANTTAKLIFSGVAASTVTITAISIKEYTPSTGIGSFANGLNVSTIRNMKGTDAVYINPLGYVGIFNKNPANALDVTGNIRVSGYANIGSNFAIFGNGTSLIYIGSSTNGVLTYSSNAWYLDNSSWRIGNPTPENGDDWTWNISSDADAGAGTTAEHFGLNFSQNATPTLGTWDFTSTQGAGWTFDKPVKINGNINYKGVQAATVAGAASTTWWSVNCDTMFVQGATGNTKYILTTNLGKVH